MTPEELLEEWTEGDTGMRPARFQQVREDVIEATGMTIPRSRSALEGWLERMQGQVTRKLREAAGHYDEGEQTENEPDDSAGDDE